MCIDIFLPFKSPDINFQVQILIRLFFLKMQTIHSAVCIHLTRVGYQAKRVMVLRQPGLYGTGRERVLYDGRSSAGT